MQPFDPVNVKSQQNISESYEHDPAFLQMNVQCRQNTQDEHPQRKAPGDAESLQAKNHTKLSNIRLKSLVSDEFFVLR